ncbi:MAG: shikimate kinase [Chloroflexota bacterium]|nr:shikimate kinase [Chloroflexota bacterium]MDQ5866595.1 shikimate kinase [Chloroflexota bacterium]
MEGAPNLVLAGFMGTGKSTVGKLLAARLQRPFVDTDALIIQKAGMPISKIFAVHGEPHFRDIERQVCLEVAATRDAVVATGGGALMDPVTRAAFQAEGVVVLLTCARNTLLDRLEESARRGARPLLGDDFATQIDRLLTARVPVYGSLPLRVDTTHLDPAEVAEKVLALYSQAVGQRVTACKP